MSSYDTVYREGKTRVRFYLEPYDQDDTDSAVLLERGDRSFYLSPDEADRVGSALVRAAAAFRDQQEQRQTRPEKPLDSPGAFAFPRDRIKLEVNKNKKADPVFEIDLDIPSRHQDGWDD